MWGHRCHAVDTSEAERLPGVQAVLTAWNTPEYRFGSDFENQTLFARPKVLHRGAVLAAVAATDLATAEAAAQCIRVTYEPLPAVLDVLEALKPDAPLLYEDLASYAGGKAAPQALACAYVVLACARRWIVRLTLYIGTSPSPAVPVKRSDVVWPAASGAWGVGVAQGPG